MEGWEWETFRAIIQDFTRERDAPPSGAKFAAGTNTTGWSIQERDGILPFGQLQIELHIWKQRFEDFLDWWELLETAGLRPFHSEVRPRIQVMCSSAWLLNSVCRLTSSTRTIIDTVASSLPK